MDDARYQQKLDELDRLLNDPTIALEPDRVWSLLSDLLRCQAARVHANDFNHPDLQPAVC